MAAGIIPRFISRTTGNEVFKLRGAIMPLAAALRDVMLSPKMDYHLTPALLVCSSFLTFRFSDARPIRLPVVPFSKTLLHICTLHFFFSRAVPET